MVFPNQQPERIAHQLVTNVGSPARIHLKDRTLTVPVEPCRGGSPPTTDVQVDSFTAVIEDADIVDGGLNLFGINGLHLPPTEWERVGLQTHWEREAADLRSPLFPPERKLEIWASREDALYETPADQYGFDHLDGLPADSPLLTEWEARTSGDGPAKPLVPFSRPTLFVYAIRAEDVTETDGFDRVAVGEIGALEMLEDLDEWPAEPDTEPREPPDFSPPPRHPAIDYGDLTPLPMDPEIVAAVHAINRHAKRLDEDADVAYRTGEGAKARVYSIRKQALYRTKTVAIHRLAKADPEAVQIELHDINGEHEMWCLSFPEGYSFHQPLDAVDDALVEDVVQGMDPGEMESEEIDFVASTDTRNLGKTLDQALRTLSAHGLDANDFLATTAVTDYDWNYEISTTFDAIGSTSGSNTGT